MLTLSCPFSSKSRFLEFKPLAHFGVSLPPQLSFLFERSAFPKYLRISQHSIDDLRKIVAELLVSDVVAGYSDKHCRSMTDKKQTVKYKRVVFWMPPKAVRHLGEKPRAQWPGALGMKHLRPRVPQKPVLVGMLFRKTHVPAANLFQRGRRQALLIDPLLELLGKRHLQGLLVAKALINRGGGGSGFARHCP